MRFELQASPEEIREKAGLLLDRLSAMFSAEVPEISDSLEKALPAKEQELKYPVLRALAERSRDLYQHHVTLMLEEIEEVLREAVKMEKSMEEDLEKGGPYIGPKGGLWADPQHTIHWTAGQPEKPRHMPAPAGPKPEDIKPFPDEAAKELLISMGDLLYGLQHGQQNKIDDSGFNHYDMGYWHSVRGNLSGMRKMLKKYKGQLVSHFGPAAFFQAGLHLVQKTEGLKVQPQYHETFGSLMLPLDGFFKGDFKKYCSVVKEKYGAQFDGNKKCFYIPKLSVANFDFAAYKEDMKKFGIEVADPIGTPPKISPAGEVAVEYKPESIEELVKGIHSYHVKDTIVVRLREDGIFEFHSPYAPAFNQLFANKGGQLSGITKYNPITKARETFDLDLTEEAIEKLKATFPKWKIVTQGVKEARIKRDQEIAELQKPIPEVQEKLDPKFKLMSYQNEGVRFLDKADGNALIGDEMGLGKTIQTLAWAAKNNKKVLVVCPKVVRKNWLEEAHKFFPGHFKGAELVASQLKKGQVPDLTGVNIAAVNYESLSKFEDAIKAAGFDTIIIDECFGPETLVDTPRGQVPIAQIQVGDEVYSAVGVSKVTGIGQKRVDGHVVLKYGGQEIRCSPCHPFFTDRGWVSAERLTLEDQLVPHREAVRLLREELHPCASAESFLRALLQCEVENAAAIGTVPGFHPGAFQKIGGSQPGQEEPGERQADARKKSHVVARGARKGIRYFAAYAASATKAVWKWLWPNPRGAFALGAAGAGVEVQSRGGVGQTPGWLSDQLQAGSGLGVAEARRRSGWLLAFCSLPKGAGPEERAQVAGIRLDSIEVHESGSYPGNEAGLYYDLRVAGHPSYVVNGALVHNSHRMKNPKAQATQNIQKIGAGMAHHILLSGTAIKNKKEELFTQLDLVAPGKFTKNAIKTAPIGGLWMDMHSVYIARAKATVLKDLPEKTTSIVKHPVPGLPDMGNENTVGAISKLKAEIAKGKTPVTKAMVQEILDTSDSKVIVFTDSVEAAKTLNEAFPEDSILHHGQLNDAARDAAVKEFQKKDEAGNFISSKRVFVTTRQSMAVGATLTAADKVVFNDLPWTAADVRQAEDRAHRIGQKNAVNVYWMTAEGNAFDENVNDILRRKYELGQKLNQGKQLTAAEMAWMSSAISVEELIAQIHGQAAGPKEGASAEDAEEPPPSQVPAAEDMAHPELAPPLPEPMEPGSEPLPGTAAVIEVPWQPQPSPSSGVDKPLTPEILESVAKQGIGQPLAVEPVAVLPPSVVAEAIPEKKPVPQKPVAVPEPEPAPKVPLPTAGPVQAPAHSFDSFLKKFGLKLKEHKTDPSKIMIKIPKHETDALAKLKDFGITEPSFEGGQYHLIAVAKQKVKDLLFGKSLDDFLEFDGSEQLDLFTLIKAGPFIGPKGGKWADAAHTIPWKEEAQSKPGSWEVVSIKDTRERDWETGKPIPGTGAQQTCERCGKTHDVVHKLRHKETGKTKEVGSGCGPQTVGGKENLDKRSYDKAKKEAKQQFAQAQKAQIKKWAEEGAQAIGEVEYPGFSGMKYTNTGLEAETKDGFSAVIEQYKDSSGKLQMTGGMDKEKRQAYVEFWLMKHWARDKAQKYADEKNIPHDWEGQDIVVQHPRKAVVSALADLISTKIKGGLQKSGPYVGPKGGLWADPQHTQHWSPIPISGTLSTWAQQLGGKVVPHKSNPSLVVVKIPPKNAQALALFKQSQGIEAPIIPGGNYLILMLPKTFQPKVKGGAVEQSSKKEGAAGQISTPSAGPDPVSGSVAGTAQPGHATLDHFAGAAESLAAAHAWVAERAPQITVHYPDLATANAVNKALSEQHPSVVKHLRFIGTPDQLHAWAKKHPEENQIALSGNHPIDLTKKSPLAGEAIAIAHPYDQKPYKRSVMVVQPSFYNEGYANATKLEGHFTVGQGLISTIRHECGHVEGFALRHLRPKGSKLSCWEIWKKHCVPQLKTNKKALMQNISDYAATNPHECWAEVSVARRSGLPLPAWVHSALAEMQIDAAKWEDLGHG